MTNSQPQTSAPHPFPDVRRFMLSAKSMAKTVKQKSVHAGRCHVKWCGLEIDQIQRGIEEQTTPEARAREETQRVLGALRTICLLRAAEIIDIEALIAGLEPPPLPSGATSSKEYREALYAFFRAGFSEPEFDGFCRLHYSDIHRDFNGQWTGSQKITFFLEYVEQFSPQQLDVLETSIEQANPPLYTRQKTRLKTLRGKPAETTDTQLVLSTQSISTPASPPPPTS